MASAQEILYGRIRARNNPLTPDQRDNQQIADLNFADQQAQRAKDARIVTGTAFDVAPNAPFTRAAAPQSAAERGPDASTWSTPQNAEAARRAAYVEAQAPQQAPPATRNNFHGAENAPDGAVVRGLDRMLYRRTGGNFVRVPPRSADDFDPTLNPQSTLGGADARLKANQQTRFDADTANFGAGIAQRNRQNAGLNGPTAQPDDGTPIGAINNMPTDATSSGISLAKRLDESRATSEYDFGLKQDELHDAAVRARQTSNGVYTETNRRSPRFGSQINWFEPGSVNPAALAPKRKKPAFLI